MFKSQSTTPVFVRTADALTKTVIGGVLAAFVTAFPLSLAAQQSPAAGPAPAAAEESNAAPAKPGVEGVKVHGHWVLDVKDKDGKIVDHRDFDNALTSNGAVAIAGVLSGVYTAGAFGILASSANFQSNGAIVPSVPSSVDGICQSGRFCSTNLVTSESIGVITLSGSFLAGSAFTVASVSTQYGFCGAQGLNSSVPNSTAPSGCSANFVPSSSQGAYFASFSGTTLTNPVALAAGQTLAITVTLSFS